MADLWAGGVLTADDTYKSRGVLTDFGILGIAHDTLLIQTVQTVWDNADVIVMQSGDAVWVVFRELAYLFAHNLAVHDVIRFVLLHDAVAFGLHGFITLVDGKVEWRFQVGIYPRSAFFDLEIVLTAAWHHPYDDGNSYDDQTQTNEKITPS